MHNTLSIFVDESGDFGRYEAHAPFYIFTLVFHDQSVSIQAGVNSLETFLLSAGFARNHCFHAGPIIRREHEYQYYDLQQRRKLVNRLFLFTRKSGIKYCSFVCEKRKHQDSVTLTASLSKQLSQFIQDNIQTFLSYKNVIIYYDNGQVELSRILASVFTILLSNVEFRKVQPSSYRLFQAADLLCTLSLASLKYERNCVSSTEEAFFGTAREFKKNYGKHLDEMRFH